ncbi:MAG TPA: lipid-A-disaccharide synthase [Steroidobacteraceae bacterium]|jgi:lipid-A-disaccharide synthase|nr:lipid-A-disaccharide synthase [Steroidobacteraceae bacterium]
MNAAVRVAIVAGETSGDTLGGALIRALREQLPDVQVRGVAGPQMRSAGCVPLADAHELAVMGLIDPLLQLPRLMKLRARLVRDISAWRPDVFVGIDAPGFNLTIAGKFRAQGILSVQYVSPQIWAWRQGRVRKIEQRYDLVLCLLPFEPAFYRSHAVRAEFVGHPMADQIPLDPDRAQARAALGLDASRPVLALLPGSRVSEVRQLARPFLETAISVTRDHPTLQVLAPMANDAVRSHFTRALESVPGGRALALRVLDGQARTALIGADAALSASGTATLEALLCRCPMVVAYRFGAGTVALLRTLRLVRVKYFSLPNLLSDQQLAPEFFQEAVTVANLAPAVATALDDRQRRTWLEQKFRQVHESLRAGGAPKAAEVIVQLLSERGRVPAR